MNDDFGDFHFVFQNVPGTARKYRGLEIKLNKRMSDRWAMQTSYVWSRGVGVLNTSRDQSTGFTGFYDDPNSMINAYGRLDYQREHLVKVQGTYAGPWGINASAYYQFGSGIPYSRVLRTYEAGLGSLYQGGVAIFAEERGTYELPGPAPAGHPAGEDLPRVAGPAGHPVRLSTTLFNNNQATSVGNTTDYDWFQGLTGQSIYGIMGPRYMQLGLIYRF